MAVSHSLRRRAQALCPGELQLGEAAAEVGPAGECAGTPGPPFVSPGSLLEGDAGATFGAFAGTPHAVDAPAGAGDRHGWCAPASNARGSV